MIDETICTMRASDGTPVEQRIIIEARRDHDQDDDSESDSSESSRDMAGGEMYRSDDSDDDDDDDDDEEEMTDDEETYSAGEEVVGSDEDPVREGSQAGHGDGDALMITISGLDDVPANDSQGIGGFRRLISKTLNGNLIHLSI